MFSARSQLDGPPNAFTQALDAARTARRPLLDLRGANPTAAGLDVSDETLWAALRQPGLGRYRAEPFGLPEAREAVAADLRARGTPVRARDVLLTASTSEAYGMLFKLLCDPGACALVPTPSYPLLDSLAKLEQVTLRRYLLRYDGRWHLDRQSLREAAEGGRARAVVAISPNNPTGSLLKRDEWSALEALELPIIADEVFADYVLAPDRTARWALEAPRRLTFRLGGLSKQAALPQLKLAWCAIAGPADEVAAARERLEHIADTYLSPSTPVQRALPALLRAGARAREAIRRRCRRNLAALRARLDPSSPLGVPHVEAGWYALLRLPATRSDEQWALELLEQQGVVAQPGYLYDLEDATYLVLSLLTPPDAWDEGLARISELVRRSV